MYARLERARNSVERQAAFYAAHAADGATPIVTGGFAPNGAGRLEVGGPIPDVNELTGRGLTAQSIGGAERAEELDSLRAIRQGIEQADSL
ncbi:hypothetical protein AC630_12170 [Bradyrhizobium sp. AS23.2]|nr:hypothetical protein AC630_12170 [Bradyrhizobium sp. AS23.2]